MHVLAYSERRILESQTSNIFKTPNREKKKKQMWLKQQHGHRTTRLLRYLQSPKPQATHKEIGVITLMN